MGAPGQGLQAEPARDLAGARDCPVARAGRLAVGDPFHPLAPPAAGPAPACRRPPAWRAVGRSGRPRSAVARPREPNRASGPDGGERPRSAWRRRPPSWRPQEPAGIAVEPVDEARPLTARHRGRRACRPDAGDAGAALDREPGRLVQDEESFVLDAGCGTAASLRPRGSRVGTAAPRRRRATGRGAAGRGCAGRGRGALAAARSPSTRTWPVRSSFSSRPWVSSGKWRRNQRSRRSSASSAVTSLWIDALIGRITSPRRSFAQVGQALGASRARSRARSAR